MERGSKSLNKSTEIIFVVADLAAVAAAVVVVGWTN
jgi:hypothetical protein